ncbi:putative monooxygenase [Escherichia coli]|nr:putative monooxygenase [Escherichia coli]
MLTVIAEIRTRPGQHHRQAVLDQFAKIVPTVLKEEGCHGYAPMVGLRCWREFPVYGTGFYRDD